MPACSDFRKAIGLDQSGPDEFAVETRAPLTIPPDFDLRPPKPGSPRPQEASAAEKARQAIDTAGPGEPGKQAAAGLGPPQGSPPALDPSQQVSDGSLSAKLLGYSPDNAAVDKRETTIVKGIY